MEISPKKKETYFQLLIKTQLDQEDLPGELLAQLKKDKLETLKNLNSSLTTESPLRKNLINSVMIFLV